MSLSGPQVRRLDDRLAERSRGLTPHQYLMFLKSPSGALELEELISAVVVHKTDLFRDEVQLSAFRAQVLAPLVERARRPLRIWSAGCATGEEVATLLVLLAEAGADPGSTVLGTDISAEALRRARWLGFTQEQLRRVPNGTRERYFVPSGERVALAPSLRERASFQLHNLMDTPYPAPLGGGGFDVIFCRNVLIYFTVEAFQRTVEALAGSLVPGGTLVLSSSEPLLQLPPSLRVLRGEQAFFYVRVDGDTVGQGSTTTPGRGDGVKGLGATGRMREAERVVQAPVSTAPALPALASTATTRLPAEPVTEDSPPTAPVDPAFEEADLLFARVLDGAATGVADDAAERDLRRCLTLDPDHSAARYLLGLLLEQGLRPSEASVEYRRALESLEAGRARPVPFFLNPARLQVACAHAAERVEAAVRRR
ncbi:CheR family methyltransferase [Pyxidicoccus xibeiensis]|uniref:CheR family methyltransferase n=1 Tax=Pyxidicoccus xibeiensis TaxID=2906759 RepID=UPI0020A6DEE4|nr:CheR family methyltransferase [Pyxidicoccus xibeiensis]MCP3140651.1 methyltransferase domain-containing protein [Pyxidicoccus xibeiensis]